jgi:hypothetical protein
LSRASAAANVHTQGQSCCLQLGSLTCSHTAAHNMPLSCTSVLLKMIGRGTAGWGNQAVAGRLLCSTYLPKEPPVLHQPPGLYRWPGRHMRTYKQHDKHNSQWLRSLVNACKAAADVSAHSAAVRRWLLPSCCCEVSTHCAMARWLVSFWVLAKALVSFSPAAGTGSRSDTQMIYGSEWQPLCPYSPEHTRVPSHWVTALLRRASDTQRQAKSVTKRRT